MRAVAALLAALLAQDAFPDLLQGLLHDDPDRRERAVQGLIDGWSRWTDADLGRLRTIAAGSEPEAADRARSALARIDVRRRIGAPEGGFLAGIDLDLLRASPEERLELLRKAGVLRDVGRLEERQLAGLVEAVAHNGWALPARGILELVTTGERRSAAVFLPLLPPLLRHSDPGIVLAAIRAAGAHRASGLHPLLVPRLADVRFEAALVDALGHADARAVAGLVAAFLSGPSRRAAAEILGRMGAVEHAEAVARLLDVRDPDALRTAAGALGRMASRDHRPALEGLLAHEDRDVRLAAAEAIGRLGLPEGAPPLVPLLKDLDAGVREGAAEALERLASPAAVEPLLPLLTDRDPVARGFSARALARCGGREHAAAIEAVLAHDHPWSRAEALRAFGRLEAEDQIDRLARLLDDEWDLVRSAAALGLADLGRPAALDRLRERRKDFRVGVRQAAEVALFRLAGEGDPVELIDRLDRDDAEAMDALLAALERAREPATRERLDREIVLSSPVESLADVRAAFRTAGLVFEDPDGLLLLLGRRAPGRTTPRRLLAFFWPGLAPWPSGDRVRLTTPSEALDLWRGPR